MLKAWLISVIFSGLLVHYFIRINLLFKVKNISLNTEISDCCHYVLLWAQALDWFPLALGSKMGFFYNGKLSKAFTPKENQEFSGVYLEIELQIRCIVVNEHRNVTCSWELSKINFLIIWKVRLEESLIIIKLSKKKKKL